MSALKLPDGTVCRTGPNCRLHGNLHSLQEQVFATYEAKQRAKKDAEGQWMEETAEWRANRDKLVAHRAQLDETSKMSWASVTDANTELHKEFAEQEKLGTHTDHRMMKLLHPVEYRRRLNLYMFACGMMDSARHVSGIGGERPGSEADRAEYLALREHIEAHYADDFAKLLKMSADSGNFSANRKIKQELHYQVFVHPKNQDYNDTPELLLHSIRRINRITGPKNERGFE